MHRYIDTTKHNAHKWKEWATFFYVNQYYVKFYRTIKYIAALKWSISINLCNVCKNKFSIRQIVDSLISSILISAKLQLIFGNVSLHSLHIFTHFNFSWIHKNPIIIQKDAAILVDRKSACRSNIRIRLSSPGCPPSGFKRENGRDTEI